MVIDTKDGRRLQPMAQKKEENKIAFTTKIRPEAIHWYKGKMHIFVRTDDGMLVIDGGQTMGRDKNGNIVVGVGPDDNVRVVGEFGQKSMSGKEFGEGLTQQGEEGIPSFGPGFPAPSIPGVTLPPIMKDLPDWEPPIPNKDLPDWEPPIPNKDLPDWEPPKGYDDLPGLDAIPESPPDVIGPDIPETSSDLKGWGSYDDPPWTQDIYLNKVDKSRFEKMDRSIYKNDVVDNYNSCLQKLRDNDMLDEGDEYVIQHTMEEFEMEI